MTKQDEVKEDGGPPKCSEIFGPIKKVYCILSDNPRRMHYPEVDPEPVPEPSQWGHDSGVQKKHWKKIYFQDGEETNDESIREFAWGRGDNE